MINRLVQIINELEKGGALRSFSTQKEEDNLTLEKYLIVDEAKIKELILQIKKLTIEVSYKAIKLEQEVTETQVAQIELEKTAKEFKRLHYERN